MPLPVISSSAFFINHNPFFMNKKFYSQRLFFISILLLIGIGFNVKAQIRIYMSRDLAAGVGDGSHTGDEIVYTAFIHNSYSEDVTQSMLIANVPAGTAYMPNTTKFNGALVADVNGKMPFSGAGLLINSPGAQPGVIPVGDDPAPTIEYRVKVTANSGTLTHYMKITGVTTYGPILAKSDVDIVQLQTVCSAIYQTTGSTAGGSPSVVVPYQYIRPLNVTNGQGGAAIFDPSGPCHNAITGTSLPAGSVLTNGQALAYDKNSNRMYFINQTTNNPAQDLCYIDLNASPVAAYQYVGVPLESNTAAGFNINRMAFGADGYGYAVTDNGQDLIRFSIDPVTNMPSITRLGALINDPNNGANDVLAYFGGDMYADGSGFLYLLLSHTTLNMSRVLFKINPVTRVATSLGIQRGGASVVGSVAPDGAGNLLTSGDYATVYKANLFTQEGMSIGGSTLPSSNIFKSGAYSSCALPVLTPEINFSKTYVNTVTGNLLVNPGDLIEFTITVTNTGNLTATNTKLFDVIPPGCQYVANSTTLKSGTSADPVPDVNGSMPYSVSGGQFISTRLELAAGIIKPGNSNKVEIKYRVTAGANPDACSQANISYSDTYGNTVALGSNNIFEQPEPTCLIPNGSARIAVNGQPVLQTIPAVQVRPNPFVNNLNLQVQSNIAERVQVRLVDFYGRTVYARSEKVGIGANSLNLHMPAGLSAGLYVLELWSGNNRLLQKKLIKK
jgi:uncharacterized repeat protein (TIGR01451 family)